VIVEEVRKEADERYVEQQKKLLASSEAHEAALAASRKLWSEREAKSREELEAHWQKRLDEAVHGLQVVAAAKELEIGRLLRAQEAARQLAESASTEGQSKLAQLRQELEDDHERAASARREALAQSARDKAASEEQWRLRNQEVKDELLRVQAATAVLRAERDRMKEVLVSVQHELEERRRRIDEAEARGKEAEARSQQAEARGKEAETRRQEAAAGQDSLVAELEHMRAAAADRERRLSELQARLENTESSSAADESELRAELETLRREKAELLARLEEIESRPQIEAAAAAAAASAADELSLLRASEADLKAKLAKSARASDSAARERTQMELRLRAFEAELQRLKKPAWKRWFAKPKAVAAPEEEPKKDPLGE
jgi:hypothetical protein